MEEADQLLEKQAADEAKPFEEKYKARDLLKNLREHAFLADKFTKMPELNKSESENVGEDDSAKSSTEGSAVMRCALALVMYKLGVNFYETEELSEGLAHLKKSLELMDSLPDQFKLRHMNTTQDLYNHIGLVYS